MKISLVEGSTSEVDVKDLMRAPEGWKDTPEQAQLRKCVTEILKDKSPAEAVKVASDLITVTRDQLLAGMANVRRRGAEEARVGMSPAELSAASGLSRQTISRLLTEARAL